MKREMLAGRTVERWARIIWLAQAPVGTSPEVCTVIRLKMIAALTGLGIQEALFIYTFVLAGVMLGMLPRRADAS